MSQTLFLALDADEFFDVGIPSLNVFITNGPVYSYSVFHVGFKIQVTPTVAMPAPHDGAAANVLATDPVEALVFVVVALVVFYDPVFIVLVHPPV